MTSAGVIVSTRQASRKGLDTDRALELGRLSLSHYLQSLRTAEHPRSLFAKCSEKRRAFLIEANMESFPLFYAPHPRYRTLDGAKTRPCRSAREPLREGGMGGPPKQHQPHGSIDTTTRDALQPEGSQPGG